MQERLNIVSKKLNVPTNGGYGTIHFGFSSGWGKEIPGWVLAFSGLEKEKMAHIHLAVADRSEGFKNLFSNAGDLTPVNTKRNLRSALEAQDSMSDTTESSLKTEYIIARLALSYMRGTDLLFDRDIAKMVIQLANKHIPSPISNTILESPDNFGLPGIDKNRHFVLQ